MYWVLGLRAVHSAPWQRALPVGSPPRHRPPFPKAWWRAKERGAFPRARKDRCSLDPEANRSLRNSIASPRDKGCHLHLHASQSRFPFTLPFLSISLGVAFTFPPGSLGIQLPIHIVPAFPFPSGYKVGQSKFLSAPKLFPPATSSQHQIRVTILSQFESFI